MTTREIKAVQINLRHATDPAKVARLAVGLDTGRQGRPVVVYEDGDGYRNITGCHRIAAAYDVGELVQAVVLEPETDEQRDALDFAAALEDPEAAEALRPYWPEAAALVELG